MPQHTRTLAQYTHTQHGNAYTQRNMHTQHMCNIHLTARFLTESSVFSDPSLEQKTATQAPQNTTTYELPCGTILDVPHADLSACCEPLFTPEIQKWNWKSTQKAVLRQYDMPSDMLGVMKLYCGSGLDPCEGIHEMCRDSVLRCDKDLHEVSFVCVGKYIACVLCFVVSHVFQCFSLFF